MDIVKTLKVEKVVLKKWISYVNLFVINTQLNKLLQNQNGSNLIEFCKNFLSRTKK